MTGNPKPGVRSSRIRDMDALRACLKILPYETPARFIAERALFANRVYSAELHRVGEFVQLRAPMRKGVIGGYGIEGSAISAPRLVSAGGVRGTIKGYSSKSRRRLFREINKLDPALGLPLFGTLTLPGGYGVLNSDFIGQGASPVVMAAAFKAFKKRLRRAYPDAVGLWRSEWQIRAALHWHLALWLLGLRDGRDLREFQKWLSKAWYECVGSGDERHLRAGTQIVTARKARGVLSYLGKEIGKSHQGACEAAAKEFGSVGRPWGYINREGLRARQGEIEIVKVSAFELLEIAVELAQRSLAAGGGAGHSWRSDPGLSAFVDDVLAGADQAPEQKRNVA